MPTNNKVIAIAPMFSAPSFNLSRNALHISTPSRSRAIRDKDAHNDIPCPSNSDCRYSQTQRTPGDIREKFFYSIKHLTPCCHKQAAHVVLTNSAFWADRTRPVFQVFALMDGLRRQRHDDAINLCGGAVAILGKQPRMHDETIAGCGATWRAARPGGMVVPIVL